MNSVEELNRERARNWFANLVLSKRCVELEKRDKHLWLFSSWAGMRFADNSRYLFEWMTHFHPEITCIWQTGNQQLYEEMSAAGHRVQLIGAEDAVAAQRLAGVCICTHGVDDFGPVPEIYGSKIVFLGHGPIAKKLWRSQLDPQRGNVVKRVLSDEKWRLFNYMKADIYLACSENEMNALREALLIDVGTPFVISGLPRNDALSLDYSIDEIFDKSYLSDHPQLRERRLAVYMPTFRRQKDCVVTDGIVELANNSHFAEIMNKHKAVLVCKMHYLSNVAQVSEKDWLVLAKDDDVIDTQKLMANAEFLATDYSSCAIDFALTGRPTCYFYPDGQCGSSETPMLPIFSKVSSLNRALSVNEFVDIIDKDLSGVGSGRSQSAMINAYFNTDAKNIGHFCSRTFEGIRQILEG